LSGGLHGRRLYAYGGVMKEVAAELKIKDVDKANLITVDADNKINTSVVKAVLTYRWSMGVSNYVLTKEKKPAEDWNDETTARIKKA